MEHISFHDYWKCLSPAGKTELSAKVHASVPYLSQIANGHRRPSRPLTELMKIITGKELGFDNCCED